MISYEDRADGTRIYRAVCDECGKIIETERNAKFNGLIMHNMGLFHMACPIKEKRNKDTGKKLGSFCQECWEKEKEKMLKITGPVYGTLIKLEDGKIKRETDHVLDPEKIEAIGLPVRRNENIYPSDELIELVKSEGHSETDLVYLMRYFEMPSGTTIDKIKSNLKQIYDGRRYKLKEMRFGRLDCGDERKGFDYLSSIVNTSFSDRKEMSGYIKKNIKGITKSVISQIETDRRFTKYGIPVNFLKPTEVTILSDCSISYKFDLKTRPDKKEKT